VGTNPICCFVPGAAGESFQLDMATTTVPIGKVWSLTLTLTLTQTLALTHNPSPNPNPNPSLTPAPTPALPPNHPS